MRNVSKKVSPPPTRLFCSVCWNDFAYMPPEAELLSAYCFFSLPATSTQLFFFRNCFSTFHTLYSCFEFFLLLTTSAISGATNSNKSAPTRFAAGTTYLRKLEVQFSDWLVQVQRTTFHAVDQYPYRFEFLPIAKVGGFSKHQSKTS